LPFLRPGKPSAKTGAEIGDSQSEACHGVELRSNPKPGGTGMECGISCAATRSRANWRVTLNGEFGCLFYARASHRRRPERKLA